MLIFLWVIIKVNDWLTYCPYVTVCAWGRNFWLRRESSRSERGCSAQGMRRICIRFLPKWRMMSSEHHRVTCQWCRPLCMVSVMSVLERYKRKNAQEGAFRPGFQSYKVSSFWEHRVFRCVLTLGLPGNLYKQKTKCWFNCFPNCEPLSGQTLVFNTLVCLSNHQENVPNSMKIGVPDIMDHWALLVLT